MRLNKKNIKQKAFQIISLLSAKKSPNIQLATSKTDVLIWGCNEFSLHLYHLLTRNNVNVMAFIDNHFEHSSYCSKPVYNSETFKTKVEYSSLPIVIASAHNVGFKGPVIDFETIKQFKQTLLEITNDHQVQNPLLHPAALFKLSNCTYPKKILAFGMPGSGNTIYNNIFIRLIEIYKRKFKTFNVDAHFFEKMCYEYSQCIKQTISDAIYSIGGRDIMVVPWNIGSSTFSFTHNNKKTRLYIFPTQDHISHRAFAYHHIPSMPSLDNLIARQFKLFLIARNPFDIIVSLLKKSKKMDIQTRQINFAAFCEISKNAVHELTHWSHYFSKLEMLKYEDLIQQPTQQISHIMRKLGITPSTSVAKKLWAQLGFKQLPKAPKNHFKGGGSGKWETHFQAEHLAFLHKIGIEAVLEKYNYHGVLEQFNEKIRNLPQELLEKSADDDHATREFHTLDIHQHALNYLKSATRGENNFVQCGCFYTISDNPVLIKKMQDILDNDYIKKLIASGEVPGPGKEYPSLR